MQRHALLVLIMSSMALLHGAEPALSKQVPRFKQIRVANLDFQQGVQGWTLTNPGAKVLPAGGPGKSAALQLSSEGKADRTLALSRGEVNMQSQRYLLCAKVLVRDAKARASMSLACGSMKNTGVAKAREGWQDLEAIIDTQPFFPGQTKSSVTVALRASGTALLSQIKLFAIPTYGIYIRYKVLKPANKNVAGHISIIRRHRDKSHKDPERHRFGSSVACPGGNKGTPAGQFSDWLDLRRYLFGTRTSTVSLKLWPQGLKPGARAITTVVELACHVNRPGAKKAKAAKEMPAAAEDTKEDLGIDLEDPNQAKASGPAAHVFFRAKLASENGFFLFMLPENDIPPKRFVASARFLDQEIEERYQWAVRSLPPLVNKPWRIPIGVNLSPMHNLLGPQAIRRELEILAQIGVRAVARGKGRSAFDAVRAKVGGKQPCFDRSYAARLSRGQGSSPYDGTRLRETLDKKYGALAKSLGWQKAEPRVYAFDLGDEPGNFGPDAADLDAFRAFLRKQGLTPEAVGAGAWDEVLPHGFTLQGKPEALPKPEADGADTRMMERDDAAEGEVRDLDLDEKPEPEAKDEAKPARVMTLPERRRLYYTRLFCAQKTSDYFKTMTEVAAKHLPGALTHVNFRAGLRRVLTPETADWFQMGRDKAVTLMWNEDWLNTYGWRNNGIQLVSYYVELMRTAARKHDLPIGGFLMCFWGQAELKSYSALAHGSRYLHYWRYGPAYANYLPYSWSHNKDTVKQIATVCRDVARLEDTLMEAKRQPASVALLYAKADPIWGRSQAENRLVYFALLHDQIPVDILTEAQIEEDGLLKRYKTLYITDVSVRQKTLGAIARWVKAGGQVWLSGGAALRDEFNEPCAVLMDALGVQCKAGAVVEKSLLQAKGEPEAKTRTPYQLQAKGDAKVSVRFADKTPALVTGTAGQGRYCVTAFRPGALYEATVRPFFNRKHGKGRIQSGWRAARRSWVTAFTLAPQDPRPVRLDRPCVEAILYRHPKNDILMLINYSGIYPEKPMQIAVQCAKPVTGVESLRQGTIRFTQTAGWVRFALSIQRTDSVLLQQGKESP